MSAGQGAKRVGLIDANEMSVAGFDRNHLTVSNQQVNGDA
jgi:hypothetical protein